MLHYKILIVISIILILSVSSIASADDTKSCIKKISISKRIDNSQCTVPCNAVIQDGSIIGGILQDNCYYVSMCINPGKMYDKSVFIQNDNGIYSVPSDEELGNGMPAYPENVAYQACYRVTSISKKNGKIVSKESYDECRKLKNELAWLIGTFTHPKSSCKGGNCVDERILDTDGTILRPKAWVCRTKCG